MNERLQRLLKSPRTMSCRVAADVLGMSEATVSRLVQVGSIGSERICARKDLHATHRRLTTFISRAAVLRYIARTCHGDERTELMHDITTHCPQLLETAQRALATPEPRKSPLLFGSQLPRRAASSSKDPFADHPDLFGGAA